MMKLKIKISLILTLLTVTSNTWAAPAPRAVFTPDEARSILDKTAEAIDLGFYTYSSTIRALVKNSDQIYPLPSGEFSKIQDRILILPSTLATANEKKPLCVVAQPETFHQVLGTRSVQTVADHVVLFKDLPASEKETLKKEMARAREAHRLPAHCSFEYL